MIKLSKITIIIIMTLSSMIIANYPSFAMHDNELSIIDWIMGDNSTDLRTFDPSFDLPRQQDSIKNEPEETIIEQLSQYQWLTYDDPILQFSIEHPSTWEIVQYEDMISFLIPDTYYTLSVETEPLLTLDHSDYARDTLNEIRGRVKMEVIGINETSINGHPATMAQYHSGGNSTFLGYFMVTDDHTGYQVSYATDDDQFSRYMPIIDRMVSTFKITK
jgi:hypothetical protein